MQGTLASHSAQPGQAPPTSHLPSPLLTTNQSGTDRVLETDNSTSPGSEAGSLQLTSSGTNYVNSSHWAAVLNGIAELKDHFESEGNSPASTDFHDLSIPERTGPQLLYGCSKFPTRQEIIESIPPRQAVDRLVSRYFSSFEMSTGQYCSKVKLIVKLTAGRSCVAQRSISGRGRPTVCLAVTRLLTPPSTKTSGRINPQPQSYGLVYCSPSCVWRRSFRYRGLTLTARLQRLPRQSTISRTWWRHSRRKLCNV